MSTDKENLSVKDEFSAMVRKDLAIIKRKDKMSCAQLYEYHRKLDGRYQTCISEWARGLWGQDYLPDGSLYIHYSALRGNENLLKENFVLIAGKLDCALTGNNLTANLQQRINAPEINIQNNFNPTITFSQALSNIEKMEGLTQKQKEETIAKIKKIENITSTPSSKKEKWEKIGPILAWLGDKSFELAKIILPLILKIAE